MTEEENFFFLPKNSNKMRNCKQCISTYWMHELFIVKNVEFVWLEKERTGGREREREFFSVVVEWIELVVACGRTDLTKLHERYVYFVFAYCFLLITPKTLYIEEKSWNLNQWKAINTFIIMSKEFQQRKEKVRKIFALEMWTDCVSILSTK